MLLLGPLSTDQAKRFFIVYTNPNFLRSIASHRINRPALTEGVGASQG